MPALVAVVQAIVSACAHHRDHLDDAVRIGGLIAAGLSNSEIADRPVLSVRTVESHIYRACAKLDVTDRDQLAAIVGQSAAN